MTHDTADALNNTVAPGRKERLLEAAIAEFSRRGLAGARIDSIARAAGVNKQLLYHYFGDKAQLQRAVVSEVMRRQDQVDSHHPMAGGLRKYLAERYIRENTRPLAKLWGRLLAWEALEHGARGSVHFEERRARTQARIVEPVRQAQAAGEIDQDIDPVMLALAISAIEFMPRTLPNLTKMVTGYNGDEPEFAERLIKLMEDLIARLRPAACSVCAANQEEWWSDT